MLEQSPTSRTYTRDAYAPLRRDARTEVENQRVIPYRSDPIMQNPSWTGIERKPFCLLFLKLRLGQE